MKILPLLILTSLFLFSCNEKKLSETDQPETDPTENLKIIIDSLRIENDSLIELLSVERPESNYWYDPLYDGKNLLQKGISNPAEFIENSLREQSELMPLKGVLGGTMRFGKIQPLGCQWVIAYYDDGHIEGRAIYKYKLNKKGKLEFELLDSMEPE